MDSFELATEGILVLDESWCIRSANHCAQALLHSAQPDLSGIDFWDAVPREVSEEHRGPVNTAVKLAGMHSFIAYLRFEDQWVEYGFQQRTIGMVVNLRDVTSTQKILQHLDDSERRNRMLFDRNPNAMWIFDVDTLKVRVANDAAVVFYGIQASKFQTLKIGALFPDGEGAALQFPQPAAAGADKPPRLQICKQKKANGDIALVELATSPITLGDRPCILVSVADVSERHLGDAELRRINLELELQLEQSTTALHAATRDLGAFEQALSNELKDPLHVLNGFAKALATRYAAVLDAQGMHYLSRIQASTRQLARLVDDLRILTRLPSLPWTADDFDLVPICTRLIQELRGREPKRNVVLEMPAHLWVRGDKNLLGMAMGHLLDNAWKFTARKDEAWIQLGFMPSTFTAPVDPDALQDLNAPQPQEPERVLFVSDNGAGFDETYSDKLFNAFQRLHSSADFPGNGLGLVIVRRVAAKMNGRVWASSADGAGASFFMSLPASTIVDSKL